MKKNFSDYEKPSVTTDVVLFRTNTKSNNARKEDEIGLQVLLIKRDEEPFNGQWTLPGGFVNVDERIKDTLKAKLKDKAGIENIYLDQLHVFDAVERDSRGRVISVCYLGITNKNEQTQASKETKWFWIEDNKLFNDETTLLVKDLAFDHSEMIEKALYRMKNEILYSDILFEFLPELFTIKEAQQVIELIACREVDNIKRMLGNRIIETDKVFSEKAHRPARYFKKS